MFSTFHAGFADELVKVAKPSRLRRMLLPAGIGTAGLLLGGGAGAAAVMRDPDMSADEAYDQLATHLHGKPSTPLGRAIANAAPRIGAAAKEKSK